jgi:hypothetical protein
MTQNDGSTAPPRYRTSFAPETISPERNEHDQSPTKCCKINDRIVYPATHDGLVTGSNPGRPTTAKSSSSSTNKSIGVRPDTNTYRLLSLVLKTTPKLQQPARKLIDAAVSDGSGGPRRGK